MIDRQLVRFAEAGDPREKADTVRRRVRILAFTAAAIAVARQYAGELIDRLVRTAGVGEHFVACVTRRVGREPCLHAGIVIVRPRTRDTDPPRAQISDPPTRGRFATLLMFGRLAEEPVGLVMRSCGDSEHDVAGHSCVVRGWVAHRGRAAPLRASTVRVLAGGSLGPHPCLPPHPAEGIQYEKAYSLYPDKQ